MEGGHPKDRSNAAPQMPRRADFARADNTDVSLNAPGGAFSSGEPPTGGADIQAQPNSQSVATRQVHSTLQAGGCLLPSDPTTECRPESCVDQERHLHSLLTEPVMEAPQARMSPDDSHLIQSSNITVGAQCELSTPALTLTPFLHAADNGQTYVVYQAPFLPFQQPSTQFPLGMSGVTAVPAQTHALEPPAGYSGQFSANQQQRFFPAGVRSAVAQPLPEVPGQQYPAMPNMAFGVAGGGQSTHIPVTLHGPLEGATFQVSASSLVDSHARSYAATLDALANLPLQYSISEASHAQPVAHYSGNERPLPPFENTLHGPGLVLQQRQLALTARQTQSRNERTTATTTGPRFHTSQWQRTNVPLLPYYEARRILSHEERNAAVRAWLDDCERVAAEGKVTQPPPPSIEGSTSATLESPSLPRQRTLKNKASRGAPQKRPPALGKGYPAHPDPSSFQAGNRERWSAGEKAKSPQPPSSGDSTKATSGSSSLPRERTCKNQGSRHSPEKRSPALRNDYPETPSIPGTSFQAAISRPQRPLLPDEGEMHSRGRPHCKGHPVEQAVRGFKDAQFGSDQAELAKPQLPRSQQKGKKQRALGQVPLPVSGRQGWSPWYTPAPPQSQCRQETGEASTAHSGHRTPGGAVEVGANKGMNKDALKSSRVVTSPRHVSARGLADHLVTGPSAKEMNKQGNSKKDHESSAADDQKDTYQQKAVDLRTNIMEQTTPVENVNEENTAGGERANDQVARCTSKDATKGKKKTELQASPPERQTELPDADNASSEDTIVAKDDEQPESQADDAALQYLPSRETAGCAQPQMSAEKDKFETVSSPENPRTGSPEIFYALFQDSPNSPEKHFIESEDDWLFCLSKELREVSIHSFRCKSGYVYPKNS